MIKEKYVGLTESANRDEANKKDNNKKFIDNAVYAAAMETVIRLRILQDGFKEEQSKNASRASTSFVLPAQRSEEPVLQQPEKQLVDTLYWDFRNHPEFLKLIQNIFKNVANQQHAAIFVQALIQMGPEAVAKARHRATEDSHAEHNASNGNSVTPQPKPSAPFAEEESEDAFENTSKGGNNQSPSFHPKPSAPTAQHAFDHKREISHQFRQTQQESQFNLLSSEERTLINDICQLNNVAMIYLDRGFYRFFLADMTGAIKGIAAKAGHSLSKILAESGEGLVTAMVRSYGRNIDLGVANYSDNIHITMPKPRPEKSFAKDIDNDNKYDKDFSQRRVVRTNG